MKQFVYAIWRIVTLPISWVRTKLRRPRPTLYRAAHVEDLPELPKALTVYIAGEGPNVWGAAMLCPCGCGETIELNLLRQARPCWTVTEHEDGSVTLLPSVWRQKGCKSHFFVRHGHIDWC